MSSSTPSLTILSEEQKFNGENLLSWTMNICPHPSLLWPSASLFCVERNSHWHDRGKPSPSHWWLMAKLMWMGWYVCKTARIGSLVLGGTVGSMVAALRSLSLTYRSMLQDTSTLVWTVLRVGCRDGREQYDLDWKCVQCWQKSLFILVAERAGISSNILVADVDG